MKTLILMLFLCMTVALTGYRSDRAALVAIILCLSYIGINWLRGGGKSPHDECLIGLKKEVQGVLFGGCVDIWHVYHIVFWILIGLLSPNNWKLAVTASFLWEFFEHVSFKYIMGSCHGMVCGRVEDVFLNIFGYSIGSFIATRTI